MICAYESNYQKIKYINLSEFKSDKYVSRCGHLSKGKSKVHRIPLTISELPD
jgi:hypothetical protein